MVQQSNHPQLSAEIDHDGALSQAQSVRRPAPGRPVAVRMRTAGQVVVLDAACRLHDAVTDLDKAIQLALADGPRGVVCDLSAVPADPEPSAVEMLAKAGRHVRDWPGIPVAVACADPLVREALSAHPLGRHLIVTSLTLPAVSAVLATPVPVVEWLRLTPHPTAPRAARNFVTRTLLDWGLETIASSAALVISELVTNSTVHAGTDIAVSVALSPGALRLTVRDKSPDLPHLQSIHLGHHGRGLVIVAGLSRGFGVLPTAEGGKVVWAVLDAPATTPRPVHAARCLAGGTDDQPR